MKNIILLLTISIFPVVGFSQNIGYDLDKNGCNKATGLTYSKIKKECIQTFNEPILLQSVDDGTKTYSTQTPLIFNEDLSKVEVFLPDSNKSLILKQKNASSWKKCGVQVDKVGNGYEMRQKGKLIYKSE